MPLDNDDMSALLCALLHKFSPGEGVVITEADIEAVENLFPDGRTMIKTEGGWGGVKLSLVSEAEGSPE